LSTRLEIMKISVRANGFTLLELMVALVVVSILLTVGLPSFSASVRQNCTITAANTLLTVLTAARSEALKRDRNVGVCPSANGAECSGAAWAGGYMMYVDTDGNGSHTGTEPILRVERPLSTCATITGNSPFASGLTYTGLGKPRSIGGSFLIESTDSSRYKRSVVVSVTGRPRVCKPIAVGTDEDDEGAVEGGGVYKCPSP